MRHMTREEALEVIPTHYTDKNQTRHVANLTVEHIINTVYDDLETRTCENCKYYTHSDTTPYIGMECTANNGAMSIVCFATPTFGCNKFEREED